MIIKETPWEKRNLGVKSSVEFYFEKSDKVSDLSPDIVGNKNYEYQVAHIPVGMVDVLNRLLQNGYMFAETKIELKADLIHLCKYPAAERYCDFLGYHRANDEEKEIVYAKMREGIFDTDKVALDPFFNKYIAGNRYTLWTEDEINSGRGYIFIVTKKDDPFGFFVIKKVTDRVGDSFLAGLFDKDYDVGLSFSVLYYPMIEARKMGFKKIITGVSSNNPDSVKMHLALGYQIKSMNYTLIKHA